MKLRLLAAILISIASTAQAQTNRICNPDPLEGAWPSVTVPSVYQRTDGSTYVGDAPAAPGDVRVFEGQTVTVNPNKGGVGFSGQLSWPWAWQEANNRLLMASETASMGLTRHANTAIDYQQLHDAVVLVATAPYRPGIPSGATEHLPATGTRPALDVPIYSEPRFSPRYLPNGFFAVLNRETSLRYAIFSLELTWGVGPQHPGVDGLFYISNFSRERYTGIGFPPEMAQAIYQLWLPAPTTGHCQL